MKIMIINGPNINLLGIRETNIYGIETYDDMIDKIEMWAKELKIEVACHQSNHEGELIDFVQQAYFSKFDGIIINAGGYTHTSIALMDAIKAINIPTIEVHISDIYQREDYRKISFIKEVSFMSIVGEGILGYKKALQEFASRGKI